MAKWKLRLLGDEQLQRNGRGALEVPDVCWPLVAALIMAPSRKLNRGVLAGRLWPEKSEHAARHCLASALWRIRSRNPGSDELICVEGDSVRLAFSSFDWIDVIIFMHRATRALRSPDRLRSEVERRRLRSALALYRGEFLSNRDLEWAAVERERLRTLRLDALFALASAEIESGNWNAARATAQSLCAIEPLREDAQRLLMTAHDRCGCRALAITQYRSLARLLSAELGIAPMMETQQLAAQLQDGRSSLARTPASAECGRQALFDMKEKLEASLEVIEAALTR